MTADIIFKTNSSFKSVNYDDESENWQFHFSDNIHISSSGFWRLLKSNKIVLISLDHGHQFGLQHPKDLIEKLTTLLTEKNLTEMKVDKDTGDLKLSLSEDITIEIFISSSGYETYDFSIYDKRYLGLGSGEIGIIEGTDNHTLTTIKL